MHCNYAMMSPRVISPEEKEGANVDGIGEDEVEREGGAAKSDCGDLNWTSLRLTIA